jgi:hypothetical protein
LFRPKTADSSRTRIRGFGILSTGSEIDVAQALSEYWIYFLVIAGALIAFGFSRKGHLEAEQDGDDSSNTANDPYATRDDSSRD